MLLICVCFFQVVQHMFRHNKLHLFNAHVCVCVCVHEPANKHLPHQSVNPPGGGVSCREGKFSKMPKFVFSFFKRTINHFPAFPRTGHVRRHRTTTAPPLTAPCSHRWRIGAGCRAGRAPPLRGDPPARGGSPHSGPTPLSL